MILFQVWLKGGELPCEVLPFFNVCILEVDEMAFSDCILVAVFCMSVVFAVLAMLWGIIRLYSSVIRIIEKSHNDITDGSK
jgi:hypothetical protein